MMCKSVSLFCLFVSNFLRLPGSERNAFCSFLGFRLCLAAALFAVPPSLSGKASRDTLCQTFSLSEISFSFFVVFVSLLLVV
jgi:hypothetical protein